MNFADGIVLRLADPATRAAVFDAVALAQLVDAQYDTSILNVGGPFSAVFDRLELGVAFVSPLTVQGSWFGTGGADRVDAHFALAGMTVSALRVDAFWRGRIVVRTALGGAHVDRVATAWPDGHAIDAAIIAALGALPSDPATLEHERRTRYLALLRAGSADPAAASDAVLDDRLRAAGADSVGALFAAAGNARIGAVQVHFTDAPSVVIATPLEVAFALLVRDTSSIAELLATSKAVREQLAPLGYGIPHDSRLPIRYPLGIAWVVPRTLFDDPAWPGADAAARRAAAGVWLAREGIGLVATA